MDVAALLEPRVPGDAHPGQERDLLPAQADRATAAGRRQAVGGPVESLPARAQEAAELVTLLGRRPGPGHPGGLLHSPTLVLSLLGATPPSPAAPTAARWA